MIARLHKVLIGSCRISHSVILHYDKRNAVRQTPLLVWALSIETQSAHQQRGVYTDNMCIGRVVASLNELNCCHAINVAQGIANFD